MKAIASSILTFAATAALVVPFAFPNVVKGCSDPSYRFATLITGGQYDVAADMAKNGFCRTLEFYNQ